MSKYRRVLLCKHVRLTCVLNKLMMMMMMMGPVFETDRQVATVVMETTQLVLSQFKNFLTQ